MFGAVAIVSGIALVDSLNPGTIGPALVLAVSAKPVRRILEFTLGFFLVNVAGGILLVYGPGHLLLSLLPTLGHDLKHVLMIVGGVALIAIAIALLALHVRLTRPRASARERPARSMTGSAFVLGAGIALAELPTAFPYFAAIAAIVAADESRAADVVLVVLFNVLFLAPLVALAVLLRFFPHAWERFINPVRGWMTLHWPQVLAAILGAGGVALVVAGVSS